MTSCRLYKIFVLIKRSKVIKSMRFSKNLVEKRSIELVEGYAFIFKMHDLNSNVKN